ncbi:Rv3654c family TadE-like protein [Streptomyces sp. URMC 123]|uniref:Rv3654c family TadE-like protein n=1 Tax=Streptomyces sp. URMC 123 TaxID=3423403 RepID=UPI003F19E619
MALAALCVVCAALLAMGQAVVTRHRAAGAADLAALAAADHALEGRVAACARAAHVAAAHGARVVRCAVRGEIADLAAETTFGPFTTTARARAGPPGPTAATPPP